MTDVIVVVRLSRLIALSGCMCGAVSFVLHFVGAFGCSRLSFLHAALGENRMVGNECDVEQCKAACGEIFSRETIFCWSI